MVLIPLFVCRKHINIFVYNACTICWSYVFHSSTWCQVLVLPQTLGLTESSFGETTFARDPNLSVNARRNIWKQNLENMFSGCWTSSTNALAIFVAPVAAVSKIRSNWIRQKSTMIWTKTMCTVLNMHSNRTTAAATREGREKTVQIKSSKENISGK